MRLIYKFFTHEDRFHMHKILGIICLFHFIWRMYNIAKYGNGKFGAYIPVWIFAHAALSGSSLKFHIPNNRITKRPMIYPEFRAHSILFAYRSLAVMISMYYFQEQKLETYNTHIIIYTRAFIVFATLIISDKISAYYTARDTTMRGMPFGEEISKRTQDSANIFYSVSQILATGNMLFLQSYEGVFMVLFPIQLAALLMTCVRKGILSSKGWHIMYAGSLVSVYVSGMLVSSNYRISNFEYWLCTMFVCIARLKYNYNKYIAWSCVIIFMLVRESSILSYLLANVLEVFRFKSLLSY